MSGPEEWQPVVGYEGFYEVSNLARVRSLSRYITQRGRYGMITRPVRGRVLRQTIRDGYCTVSLCNGETEKIKRVHRLVLEAFVGPCPDGMEGCHGNDVRTDNRIENLRWDTPSANNVDYVRHGRHHLAQRSTCPRGHRLEAPNLEPGLLARKGHRTCWACGIARDEVRARGGDSQVMADARYAALMEGWRPRAKESTRTHCPRQHPLAGPNLCPASLRHGKRTCLACSRARKQVRRLEERGVQSDLKAVSDAYYVELMAAA